jgi:hypothetical protein
MVTKNKVVRHYFILPCCLLLLSLCTNIISYKAKLIPNKLLQTAFVMFMILVGSSLVAYILSPAIETLVDTLHQTSRRRGGEIGEAIFLVVLGVGIYGLCYAVYINGPQSVLPPAWRN